MLRDDAGLEPELPSPSTPRARHAVYLAPPPLHPLWDRGCAWLGRDARAGEPAPPPPRPELAAPWRYGFHATLKPPLVLGSGETEAAFLAAVRRLAARHAPFPWPVMQVAMLSDFVALRPVVAPGAGHPLRLLADECVIQLDAWRAPLDAAARARRLSTELSERQRGHLERWGYPHVLDDWRLHLSLSGPLADHRALLDEAERHFAPALREPLLVDSLCVFVEPAPGEPFELRQRYPLGGP